MLITPKTWRKHYNYQMLSVPVNLLGLLYQQGLKRVLFTQDPEKVHERMSANGELLGRLGAGQLLKPIFVSNDLRLSQKICGIEFNSPIGLAAGFDYNAQLTQILFGLGFGFQSVGTITNLSYEGNGKPMLGRLPKSRSLMVNKGFKNYGAQIISEKLQNLDFKIPLGISIGRSNTLSLKTQKESIHDIITAFTIVEQHDVANSYYELNISCPNLKGDISFYPPKNLHELLSSIDGLKLSKPLFIKMPIELDDKELLSLVEVIVKHSPKGVIIGNLQKNRTDPVLIADEVKKFSVGNFSGKATWTRSNELIALVHKRYKKDLVIIGCGGVFSAEDAYLKLQLGSSLVQLITGMIFQGPQLISQINHGLLKILDQTDQKSIKDIKRI